EEKVRGVRGVYRPSLLVEVWVALLFYGGKWLDDLALLRSRGVRRLFGWTRVPDPTTFGRFLRRAAGVLVPVLDELVWHVLLVRWRAVGVPRRVMLVLDSTVVVRYGTKQAGAEKGYNPKKPGRPSHHPLLAFLAETGDCVGVLWRPGSAGTAAGAVEWVQTLVGRLRAAGVREITLRLDKGFFSREMVEALETLCVRYVLKVPELAVGEGAAGPFPPLGQAHLLARDALDHQHQALRSAPLLARAAAASCGRLWRTRSRDLRGHEARPCADQHRSHPCAHGLAPLQPRRGGRAPDRGTHPARHRQDRRRRPGRQSPAVGHGCARLPAPARDPHHRSDRELAPRSARADQELDLPPERQAHTPRPQDVRPAATLRARPRRVPPRTSLHRAPQSSAAQSLSISRAHAREPRPSEPSTVVLPSSPASSKVPTPDVARCSALLLIRHSSVSKQRPARRRTIKIRPQPLCAGSGLIPRSGA